jgi:eukaryotic-like serine/threonine-protein kinase
MKNAVTIRVKLGAFQVNLKTGELHKGKHRVVLQEQPFQILLMLVEASGVLVTREEIKKKLWPNDTVVEFDHSIRTAINKLRRALEDSGDSPKYVETVARRGYRLMVPVERLESALVDASPSDEGGSDEDVNAPGLEMSSAGLIGRTVSHYRVLNIIGGGGMGVVYRAEDLKLGRGVALKFLPEELGNDPQALERFSREARAASSLDHPNICPIYEFGEHEGQPFIVMQLLEGQTLRDRLATAEGEGTLPLTELLDIALQMTDGLRAAHEKGVIHRDVKPANIFLTDKGMVKILDFGLVKLLEPGDEKEVTERENQSPKTCGPAIAKTNLHITRTGVAMGTAGYMSPEQVRGDKLDARTDLFSLGLVLYEMATGQRAFTGDTAAVVHDAILNQTPVPVQQLNSTVSNRLEQLINKALEKNRESRYRSAAEMRAALLQIRDVTTSKPKRRLLGAATAGTLILLSGIVTLWVRDRQASVNQQPFALDVKQRQLTTNTADDPVADAYISRDGKQLAYYDRRGIHIKTLATGDIKTLSPPEELKDQNVDWTTGPWLHDGKTLIGDARGLGPPSTWSFSLLDGTNRKLRDDADTYELSPDGSQLVFARNQTRLGAQELWTMDINGENARKVLVAGENSGFGDNIGWAPNGRITYVRVHETGQQREHILESFDPGGGAPVKMFATPVWWLKGGLMGWEWLPGGRLVYELTSGNTANGYSCNFWDMWVDERTGEPRSAPRQLTNWAGFCMQSLTATADYKQIAYLRVFFSFNVLIANLDGTGARAKNFQRLTTSESVEYPTAWTPDSKSVIFHSNRNGPTGIFRQAIDKENPEIVVMGTEDSVPMSSIVTPDGQMVIYTLVPNDQGSKPHSVRQIMSVPITGGSPVTLLTAQIIGSPRCAQAPATLCAIAERSSDGKQIVFAVLDAVHGRGAELLRFATEPEEIYSWDLSPDGRYVAVAKEWTNRFDVLPLAGGKPRTIMVKGWKIGVDRPRAGRDPLRGADFSWAANGKGFYVASGLFRNPVLVFVDLQGNARVVHEYNSGEAPGGRGGFSGLWGIPSPDGRHLAILNWSRNRNVWLMENF